MSNTFAGDAFKWSLKHHTPELKNPLLKFWTHISTSKSWGCYIYYDGVTVYSRGTKDKMSHLFPGDSDVALSWDAFLQANFHRHAHCEDFEYMTRFPGEDLPKFTKFPEQLKRITFPNNDIDLPPHVEFLDCWSDLKEDCICPHIQEVKIPSLIFEEPEEYEAVKDIIKKCFPNAKVVN